MVLREKIFLEKRKRGREGGIRVRAEKREEHIIGRGTAATRAGRQDELKVLINGELPEQGHYREPLTEGGTQGSEER